MDNKVTRGHKFVSCLKSRQQLFGRGQDTECVATYVSMD
ncbi:hypothetical protein LR69_04009 [Geobacillus sp. BCO2]|nr:hypothetical protein LR69_04009 [Geobacillus sp. BCO2]